MEVKGLRWWRVTGWLLVGDVGEFIFTTPGTEYPREIDHVNGIRTLFYAVSGSVPVRTFLGSLHRAREQQLSMSYPTAPKPHPYTRPYFRIHLLQSLNFLQQCWTMRFPEHVIVKITAGELYPFWNFLILSAT